MATNEATLLIKIKQIGTEILDRLVITAGDVVDAFKAVASFVGDAVEAFREEEKAINKLTTAMVNQGVFTQDLKNEYIEMASALQKVTTYGDEEIVNATAILQAYSKNREVSKELVKATLDLATAKSMDLASAAELVGKTIGTETNALARQGIEISKTSNEGERLTQVISGIESKYKDQAITAAQGLGSIDQLKNAWSDFMETIGRLSAPFVSSLAKMTTSVLQFFTALAGPNLDTAKMEEIEIRISKIRQQIELMQKARIGGDAVEQLQAELDRMLALQDQMNQKQQQSDAKKLQDQQKSREDQRTLALEQDLLDQEQQITNMNMTAEQSLQAQLSADNKKYEQATTQQQKMQALAEKAFTLDGLRQEKEKERERKKNEDLAKDRDKFLSQLASMQSSHNSVMATIGKAAAIAQITINTGEAAMSGYKWGMAIGGPPLAALFAGLAIAAGAAQAARVSGVALAEGGIVMPRPGGTQATIGEAGQAEAVIPLDRAGEFGLGGGGTTIIFQGPIMGNESQAKELARAIDRELLKLRRSNESLAFETDVV